MYIGEPFSWKRWRIERDDRARARHLHQRGAPLLYGGGGYQRK